MNFDTLNASIPYVTDGKMKSLKMNPYPRITLAQPGRHADQTNPPGGDFVVMVDDPHMGWTEHQFTHIDLFQDLEKRPYSSAFRASDLMKMYLSVILGESPLLAIDGYGTATGLGRVLDNLTFLQAVQCLAVAEHRRYARFEPQFGGRFLPFRFGAGIVEGLWTAADAAEKQKKGRPGVEWLERDFGVPILTRELMA